MEFSASGTEAIPLILISFLIPLITFILVPIFIIRSVMKAIKGKLPVGTSISQLTRMAKQLPKGAEWQKFNSQWEIKSDPITKKIIIKRKPGVPLPTEGNMQSEIQVNNITELPTLIKKLSDEAGQVSQTAIPEPPSPSPASASSKITQAQTKGPRQLQSPNNYEIIQTIKRVAIVIMLIGIFYGLKGFFA